jgi:hypothetical protein
MTRDLECRYKIMNHIVVHYSMEANLGNRTENYPSGISSIEDIMIIPSQLCHLTITRDKQ